MLMGGKVRALVCAHICERRAWECVALLPVVGRVASQPRNEDSEQRIKRQQSVEDRGR